MNQLKLGDEVYFWGISLFYKDCIFLEKGMIIAKDGDDITVNSKNTLKVLHYTKRFDTKSKAYKVLGIINEQKYYYG